MGGGRAQLGANPARDYRYLEGAYLPHMLTQAEKPEDENAEERGKCTRLGIRKAGRL